MFQKLHGLKSACSADFIADFTFDICECVCYTWQGLITVEYCYRNWKVNSC